MPTGRRSRQGDKSANGWGCALKNERDADVESWATVPYGPPHFEPRQAQLKVAACSCVGACHPGTPGVECGGARIGPSRRRIPVGHHCSKRAATLCRRIFMMGFPFVKPRNMCPLSRLELVLCARFLHDGGRRVVWGRETSLWQGDVVQGVCIGESCPRIFHKGGKPTLTITAPAVPRGRKMGLRLHIAGRPVFVTSSQSCLRRWRSNHGEAPNISLFCCRECVQRP
ncbi:hypothetical protein IWZ01DRAFT_222203 [Phyllosticta capitalensis]